MTSSLVRDARRHGQTGAVATVTPPATWWESGMVRYGMLSYSLWIRHIYWDLRGKKPKKRRTK